MAEMILLLARTVFLPKGSPGICTVRQIKADISRFDLQSEGDRIFCSGETDLLIEYLSFAEGENYPGYENFEQRIPGGGSMWQALLTLPFELSEDGAVPCPAEAELKVGEMKWYMVAPHALEMEMELLLSWEQEVEPAPVAAPLPSNWQQISLGDIKVTLGGERLSMENEEKVMRMGVSDRGWDLDREPRPVAEHEPCEVDVEAAPMIDEALADIVAEKLVNIVGEAISAVEDAAAIAEEEIIAAVEGIAAAVEQEAISIEEVVTTEGVVEKKVEGVIGEIVDEIIEKVIIVEELITVEEAAAEMAGEPAACPIAASPPVIFQTVETPYHPQPQPQPEMSEGLLAGLVAEAREEEQSRIASGRRLVGLPRLVVRREKLSQNYQVNYRIEEP